MTDNEIIKALECCCTDVREDTCPKCAFYKKHRCSTLMLNGASDLINRQKAEIEKLKNRNAFLENEYKNQGELFWERVKIKQSEVIKEFAERLKTNFNKNIRLYGRCTVYDATTEIDDLVKEMTEGKK